MPDRSKPPVRKDIQSIQLPRPEVFHLENGVPVYVTNMGTQEVVRMELVFYAGRTYERKPLVARAVSSLLKEGTRHYTAGQIAEELDFYGATLSLPFNLDTSSLVLYSLNKHFASALPVIRDMLTLPAFSERDLEAYIKRNQRRLSVDLAKNDTVAYRLITEQIFGSRHPYGYNSSFDTYAALTTDDLREHHKRLYNASNCIIFVSGKITDATLKSLDIALSGALVPGERPKPFAPVAEGRPQSIIERRPETLQSAIRLGRKAFNRQHEDFYGLYVLNTLLGGYFGSRLMTNIREEKGYTYNIYSMLETMRHDGTLLIGTEVSPEYVAPTLKEIFREMKALQETRVGEEELTMVRNFLLGNFLTMLDGPFNVSEVVRTLVLDELPLDAFDQLVSTVQNIDADTLQRLSQKYFNKAEMWQVIVGP